MIGLNTGRTIDAEFIMKIDGEIITISNAIIYNMSVTHQRSSTIVITTDYPQQLVKCLEPFCEFIQLLVDKKDEQN